MRTLAEFLVDKSVLTSQRLNIFSQFSDFLGFELGELGLLIQLLSQILALSLEVLDFLFSFE